jgi:hypothetical protein
VLSCRYFGTIRTFTALRDNTKSRRARGRPFR